MNQSGDLDEPTSTNSVRKQTIIFDALNTGPINGSLDAEASSVQQEAVKAEVEAAIEQRLAKQPLQGRRQAIKFAIIGILLVAGLSLIALHHNSSKTLNSDQVDASQRFPTTSVGLSGLSTNSSALKAQNAQTLSVNGQLNVSSSIVLAPTAQPEGAVVGQLYYNQATNELSYFNGQQFTSLLNNNQKLVGSIGGTSGNIAVGTGISVNNSTLNNTGVLTIQGESGNVTLTGGSGLVVNGTTLSNSGVLSIGGQSGNILLGSGLSLNGNTLDSEPGIQSLSASTSNVVISEQGDGNYTLGVVGGQGFGTVASSGGQAGQLAYFTSGQDIENSIISQSGGVITVSGNLSVAGQLSLGTSLSVGNGGTGAATAAGARTNLGAAASGANSDITSLSGLTTALTVNEGGTGLSALTANELLYAGNSSSISQLSNSTSGSCLVSNGAISAPSFQACPGVSDLDSLAGNLTIANTTGSGSTITIASAKADGATKGIATFNATNFTAASGVINTIQGIATTSTPTFGGLTLTNALTVGNGGTGAITAAGARSNLGAAASGANSDITSLSGLTSALTVNEGGTGAITAAGARASLGAAASGANSDITSLSGLTSALSVSQGGTGLSALTANELLFASNTSTISQIATGASGLCLVSSGASSAPSWQVCPGSGGVTSVDGLSGVITISNTTGSGSTVSLNYAKADGTHFGIATFNSTNFSDNGSGLINTIQGIATTSTPTFAGLNLTTALTVGNGGTGAATAAGARTNLGAAASGANSDITSLSGLTTALSVSQGGTGLATLTADGILYASNSSTISQLAAGTSGQCLVSNGATSVPSFQACPGVSSVDGLTGAITIANTTGSGSVITIGNADADGNTKGIATFNSTNFSDNGSGLINTIQGIATTSTPTFAGLNLTTALTVGNGGTGAATAAGARTNLGAAASGANSDITSLSGLTTALSVSQGGTGLSTITADELLYANSSNTIAQIAAGTAGQCLMSGGASSAPSYQTCPGQGGVTSLDTLTGGLTIANTSPSGSTITINSAKADGTTMGIATFSSADFTASSGLVDTIQSIAQSASPQFAQLKISSSQTSQDMVDINNVITSGAGNLLNLETNGNSQFSVSSNGGVTLNGGINGQTIGVNSSFTGSISVGNTLYAGTIVGGSTISVGAANETFSLQGNGSSDISATSGSYTTTVGFQSPTASVTYDFATAAAGTYNICTTAGNCGGVTTSGGSTNTLAMFTSSGAIGDSIITQSGSTATITGSLTVTSSATIANLTVSTALSTANITINGHIVTGGSAPTVAAGASAGSGASVSSSGNDESGKISVTLGSGASTGAIISVTFAQSYGSSPNVVVTAGNSNAAQIQQYVSPSTTGFSLNTATTGGLTSGQTYTFYYHVMQ